MTTIADPNTDEHVVAVTQRWLQRIVIGLNLCPFARAVHARNQIRYIVSSADSPDLLLADLSSALRELQASDSDQIDTVLLIHPHVLQDFFDYNQFLEQTDAALDELDLQGEIQIASFHPLYQFADTAPDDIENCTNRSPYPMLHLLRERSVERAVAAYPDTAKIFECNIETLRSLGHAGWQRLLD
ncbi:DUF1415 domain-containing protein [Pseudolysobacter antarcticus]|uniref:DUF1415 domain-containing protein n=1 Tax=Pseudolysobacter antarcticus TaxID=2511995 RepID=A0A411HNL5_9GAMM|nr:DUF1415 domain-containing protein [Pseudolysobacter antarcticus]QBB72071.1 DUF1415 domain-containing protein [Pseudolysobacter antarcticus]